MRNTPNVKAERYRLRYGSMASDTSCGNNGAFRLPGDLVVVASDGKGWDHVSVSLVNRCPTWEEMCLVKELFFRDDECVMQLHPPKSEWVNDHPYCLHLWRPQGDTIPVPPAIAVGPNLGFERVRRLIRMGFNKDEICNLTAEKADEILKAR